VARLIWPTLYVLNVIAEAVAAAEDSLSQYHKNVKHLTVVALIKTDIRRTVLTFYNGHNDQREGKFPLLHYAAERTTADFTHVFTIYRLLSRMNLVEL